MPKSVLICLLAVLLPLTACTHPSFKARVSDNLVRYPCHIGDQYLGIGVIYTDNPEPGKLSASRAGQRDVFITNIAVGSPADLTKLPVGAIIRRVNNIPVLSGEHWQTLVHDENFVQMRLDLEVDGLLEQYQLSKVRVANYSGGRDCQLRYGWDDFRSRLPR